MHIQSYVLQVATLFRPLPKKKENYGKLYIKFEKMEKKKKMNAKILYMSNKLKAQYSHTTQIHMFRVSVYICIGKSGK